MPLLVVGQKPDNTSTEGIMSYRDIEQREDNLFYMVGSKSPLHGLVKYKKFGERIIEETYAKGVKEGLSTMWYKGGQKKSETNYSKGMMNGSHSHRTLVYVTLWVFETQIVPPIGGG